MRKTILRLLGMPTWKPTYSEDGLHTNHWCGFLHDPAFTGAYEACTQAEGGEHHFHQWRLATVLWAAQVGARLNGDLIQCGVHLGGGAAAILRAIPQGKLLWLFDTFRPVPGTTGKGSPAREDTYAHVQSLLGAIPGVRLVPGTLPGTLRAVPIQKIGFLHLDLNVTPEEVQCMEILWPKMVPGAVAVLESYAFPGLEPCNQTLGEWTRQQQVPILTLPTGQGLLIKEASWQTQE